MANISKFEVFGPTPTLQRMGDSIFKETPHIHCFTREISDSQKIWVFIYEDENTAVQSSRCVTCILSQNTSSNYFEVADVGKQSGFRGSQSLDDQPVYDQLVDFILDYSKQYGLTVQKSKIK